MIRRLDRKRATYNAADIIEQKLGAVVLETITSPEVVVRVSTQAPTATQR
jgi:hypothetical protein